MEQLENRTLFSSYSITPVAALTTSMTDPGSGSNLVRDSAGDLFGTTAFGGTSNDGSVFEIPISTGKLKTIWNFDGTGGIQPNSLVIDSAGNLYGTTMTSDNTAGELYASNGLGTVFEIHVGYTTLNTLVNFADASTGENPDALTIDSAGNLFGVTTGGGSFYGTVFEVAATSHTFSTIYTFQYTDGVDSYGITAANGNLYGTTYASGLYNAGTVYELANETAPLTVLTNFDGTDSANAESAPYVDANGDIFGTTPAGGAYSEGGIFELAKNSSTTTLLASFDGTNGGGPRSTLVADSSGNLYGVATAGGVNNDGDAFEYSPSTGTITDLADFSASNGSTPAYGLIADGSGNFYGTTSTDGANQEGEVFKLSPGSSGGGTTGGGATGTGSATPTITKSTVPTAAVAGVKTKAGVVAISIANSGSAIDATTTQLYASIDGSVDSSSIALGKPKKLTVKAGATGKTTLAVPSLALPAGTYTLLAQTTDSSGNTSIATGSTVEVAVPVVTLAETVGAVRPSELKGGKTLAFTVTLTNSGNIDANDRATFAIDLSVDGSTVAETLAPFISQANVKAGGKPTVVHVHSKLSTDEAALTYYPIVTATFGDNTVTAVGQSPFSVV